MNEKDEPLGKTKEGETGRYAILTYKPTGNIPLRFREVWLDTVTGEVFSSMFEPHLLPMAIADGEKVVTDKQGWPKLPVSWLLRYIESDLWEGAFRGWERGFRKLFPEHAGKMKNYRALLQGQPDQATE